MFYALTALAAFVLGVGAGWFLFVWAVKSDHDEQTKRPPRIPPAG